MRFQISRKMATRFEEHSKTIGELFNNPNNIQDIKKNILGALPFLIAGLITAFAATTYARLFSYAEKGSIILYENLGLWTLVAVPILFFMSWFIVEKFAPFANGSGIPQLMAAAEISEKTPHANLTNKLLGFRIIIVKIISSLLAVCGGGAIGREGPTLQISGSIFHIISKYLPVRFFSKNHHELILAGGAAGLASAFNTPLGGIVYVIEELSKSHLSSFRTGILYAIIVAGLISQLIMGPYLYFGYPKIAEFQIGQIGIIIVVSIMVGLVVSFFGQFLKIVVIYRSRLKRPVSRALMAIISGLIFAAFAIYVSKTEIGSGKDMLNSLLFHGIKSTPLDVFSRFLGNVLTYSIGGAGGIFAPTLSLGGAAASYFTALFSTDLGALGVLIGMTAGLSALTHSPFTAFVLILEMTDRHSAIFPLMIATLVGQAVSKFVSKNSFYDFACVRILTIYKEEQQAEEKNF